MMSILAAYLLLWICLVRKTWKSSGCMDRPNRCNECSAMAGRIESTLAPFVGGQVCGVGIIVRRLWDNQYQLSNFYLTIFFFAVFAISTFLRSDAIPLLTFPNKGYDKQIVFHLIQSGISLCYDVRGDWDFLVCSVANLYSPLHSSIPMSQRLSQCTL